MPSCSTSVSVSELRSARMSGQEPLSASPSAVGLPRLAMRSSSSFFKHEGEEAARDVAANGLVELVKDRPRGEQTLRCAERPFHHPQLLVAEHRFERREIGVGPQHEDAVEFGVLFRLGAVDGEMVVAGRRQETAIALVADEALVALLQLPLERGQDGGPGGGVLLHLLVIATDDVAPSGAESRPWPRSRYPCPALQ